MDALPFRIGPPSTHTHSYFSFNSYHHLVHLYGEKKCLSNTHTILLHTPSHHAHHPPLLHGFLSSAAMSYYLSTIYHPSHPIFLITPINHQLCSPGLSRTCTLGFSFRACSILSYLRASWFLEFSITNGSDWIGSLSLLLALFDPL